MVTPQTIWPHSLAKRIKAFALWEGGDPGVMIARGGRIAADAGARQAAGVVNFTVAPALQNNTVCFGMITLQNQDVGEPSYTYIDEDTVQVQTYDVAGQAADLSFALVLWEPLVTEKVNDWTPL